MDLHHLSGFRSPVVCTQLQRFPLQSSGEWRDTREGHGQSFRIEILWGGFVSYNILTPPPPPGPDSALVEGGKHTPGRIL